MIADVQYDNTPVAFGDQSEKLSWFRAEVLSTDVIASPM